MNNSNLNQDVTNENSNKEGDANLFNILQILISNLKLLIFLPITIGLITLGYSFFITPTYVAKTTLTPPTQAVAGAGSSLALLGQLGGALGQANSRTSAEQYIAYLESNVVIDSMIQRFDLIKYYGVKYQQDARNKLKRDSKFMLDKKSGLLVIEVSGENPQFISDMANGYVSALRSLLGGLALKEATARREQLEHQIAKATEKTYQSPLVKDAIIQAILRDYETTLLEERKRDNPYVQQIDIAEPPQFKSQPKKANLAFFATLITGLFVLIFIFIRHSWLNLKLSNDKQLDSILTSFRSQFRFRR
jgi:capsular polysaccharide biosynthesis protein